MSGTAALANLMTSDVWVNTAVQGTLCSKSVYPGSSCDLCRRACPAESITFENGSPHIGRDCIDCGVCVSSCPNGVFYPRRGGDTRVLTALLGSTAGRRSKTFAYTCANTAQTGGNAFAFPCLGRLTEFLILGPMVFGGKSVRLNKGDCTVCNNARSLTHQANVLDTSRLLASAIGINPDRIRTDCESTEEEPAERTGRASSPRLERRGFFRALKYSGAAFASEILAAVPVVGVLPKEKPGTDNWRRQNLVALLAGAQFLSDLVIPKEQLPAGEIEVGRQCAGCGLCGFICPTSAIKIARHDSTFEMRFESHLCTACGNCERACLFKAIRLKPVFKVRSLFQQNIEALVTATLRRCSRCGGAFINSTESTCQLCRGPRALMDNDTLTKDGDACFRVLV